MPTAQPAPDLFPADLGAVPRTQWVSEQFGWIPGGFGAMAGALFCGTLFRPASSEQMIQSTLKELDEPMLSLTTVRIALLLIAVLLLTLEVRRRGRRTVLVPLNGLVGVYYNSKLVEAITPGGIQQYRLNPGRTRIIVLATLSACIPTVMSVTGGEVDVSLLLLGLTLLILFSSASFTRIVLKQWIVTTSKPVTPHRVFKEFNRNVNTEMFDQYTMLTRAESRRLLAGK